MRAVKERGQAVTPEKRKYASVSDWLAISGMSRTTFWRRLKAGDLRAVHLGSKVLVDVEHGLSFMATLPAVYSSKPGRT